MSTRASLASSRAGFPLARRTASGAVLTLALSAGLVGAAAPGSAAPVPARPVLPAAVEDLQPYVGQAGCDPVAKPGVLAFQSLLMSTYRDTNTLGIVRDCGIGGTSEHKEGRAFDWAVSAYNSNHVAEVNALMDWLTAWDSAQYAPNARRFGLMYMIWNKRIWKAYQPELGWQAYTGPSPHTDHVHFSFGWNGARKTTSWWTGKVAAVDYGPFSASRPAIPTPPTPSGSTAPASPRPTPPPPPPAPAPVPVANAIDTKHAALGGDAGFLGAATGGEADVLGGRYRPYVNGYIYWSPSTGAREVHGDILRRYLAMGGSRSALGLPTGDETPVKGGVMSSFQRGVIVWSAPTGARAVYGDVHGKYLALGGPNGLLGLPTGDEADVRGGRAMAFTGGRIYWSPTTGAREVHGGILQEYLRLGGEGSFLRLPVSDEGDAGPGRGSSFQGGGMYWSPTTGVRSVLGGIREKWLSTGGPSGFLGLPRTNEVDEPGGGRSSSFTGGSVYWSPGAGAHMAYGGILQRFLADGGAARYGFPKTDELGSATGTTQEFEKAVITYTARNGAVSVRLK